MHSYCNVEIYMQYYRCVNEGFRRVLVCVTGFCKVDRKIRNVGHKLYSNLFLFFRFKRRKRRFVVYFKDIKEHNYFLIAQKKNTLKSKIVAAIGHTLRKNLIKWSSQKGTIKKCCQKLTYIPKSYYLSCRILYLYN